MMQAPRTIDYATPTRQKSRSPLIWIIFGVALTIATSLLLALLFTARRTMVAQVQVQQARVAANAAAMAAAARTRAGAATTSGAALDEESKIQMLIDAVEQSKGIIFIRNGEQHDSSAAAQHLRRKYQSAGKKPMTAQQFIDELASRSSLSGDEYRIKLPDGREVPSRQWFGERLEEIEQGAAASEPSP